MFKLLRGNATLTHSFTSSRNRPTDPSSPRLDVTQLVPVIQGLFTAGLAESTRKAYQVGGIRYSKFCREASLTPYPASEEVLLFFITYFVRGVRAALSEAGYVAKDYAGHSFQIGSRKVQTECR